MISAGEKDINDIFDEIQFSEETHIKKGYEDGLEKGLLEGNPEGYHLGYHRGAEIGAELGYYCGVLESLETNKAEYSEKILKTFETLKKLLSNFPRDNADDVDIITEAEKLSGSGQIKFLIKMENQEVLKVIDDLIGFLDKHEKLHNTNMVDYFTSSMKTGISPDIQSELKSADFEYLVDELLHSQIILQAPILMEYVNTAKSFSLYNLPPCMDLVEFRQKVAHMSGEVYHARSMNMFMNMKKSHEVEMLSTIAVTVSNITKTSHLIDIGDGKGYLSSAIALQHSIPILGVDASVKNTESAGKRAEKLDKHCVMNTPSVDMDGQKNYKQVTQFVTEITDFDSLIQKEFKQSNTGLGIVGLHTCGNLGPASLRIFAAKENIKSICNVSCCYHLLNENYNANGLPFSIQRDGFPMSQYLLSKRYTLNKSARMLASQSIDRILDQHTLPSKIILYRAMLQVALQDFLRSMPEQHVGRFRRVPNSFHEYAKSAMKRLQVPKDLIPESLLDHINNEYSKFENELNFYHLLRNMLAPVIESLILMDRYLYLLEKGIKNVFLVQLFDPVISPRCYGLIAFKKRCKHKPTQQ